MIGIKGHFLIQRKGKEITLPNTNYAAKYKLGLGLINGGTFELPSTMSMYVNDGLGNYANQQVPVSVGSYDLNAGIVTLVAATSNAKGFDFSNAPPFSNSGSTPTLAINSITLNQSDGSVFANTSGGTEVSYTFGLWEELIVVYVMVISISQQEEGYLNMWFRDLMRAIANVPGHDFGLARPDKIYFCDHNYQPILDNPDTIQSLSFVDESPNEMGVPSWRATPGFVPASADDLPRKLFIYSERPLLCSFTPLNQNILWSEPYEDNQSCTANIYLTIE